MRVALRTQQILAYETGVARTADPLGGSYFVENLTDEFEAAAWAYLARIEAEGGALRALESGWLHGELEAQAYRHQRRRRRRASASSSASTGSRSTSPSPRPRRLDRRTRQTEKEQIERLADGQADRNAERGRAARSSSSRRRPTRGDNTIPALLEAVRAYATVGEICDVLAERWGRYR